MILLSIDTVYELNIGQPIVLVHFSHRPRSAEASRRQVRKMNEKESRQNEATATQGQNIPRRFAGPPHPKQID